MKRSKNLKNQRLFKMISLVFPVLFFNVFVVKSDFTYIECNDELCMYSDGEKRSYIDSFLHCSELNARPVEIVDLKTSHLFESFTAKYLLNEFVFLNIKIDSGWKWTNGKPVDFSKIKFDDKFEDTSHAAFALENSTLNVFRYSFEFDKISQWICSKEDESSCPKPFIVLDKKCYFVRQSTVNAYFASAVNDCYFAKATIATFENLDKYQISENLKYILKPSKLYWVGLTSMYRAWRNSDEPVLFNKWLYGKIWYADCISAIFDSKFSRSYWVDRGCNGNLPVVCMKTSLKETTKNPTDYSTTAQDTTLKNLVIAGWVVAGLLLLTLLLLLVFFLCIKNTKTSIIKSNTSISIRDSMNPVEGPAPNSPPELPKRRSECPEYIENKNYYEVPSPTCPEDRKYTALVN